jgi:hypothetical protein
MAMGSILIFRPGALGDAVLTLPLIEALLESGVQRIVLAGTPQSWSFLSPDFKPLEILDFGSRDWLDLFGGGPALGPRAIEQVSGLEAALVLLGRGREPIERALAKAGIGRVAGAEPPSLGEATSEPWPEAAVEVLWPPDVAHASRRLLATLPALGLALASRPAPRPLVGHPLLAPSEDETALALRSIGFSAPPKAGVLAVHPGSGGAAKCWPVEHFAALATLAVERLRLLPVFLIGPADAARWQALKSALSSGVEPRALVERPLREVLALLSIARAHIGNDSGITHLAARAAPTLALFGPTDPRVWHPLGPRVVVLRAPNGKLVRLAPTRVFDALAKLSRT